MRIYNNAETAKGNGAREHFEKSVRKTLRIPVWLDSAAQEQHINIARGLDRKDKS